MLASCLFQGLISYLFILDTMILVRQRKQTTISQTPVVLRIILYKHKLQYKLKPDKYKRRLKTCAYTSANSS
jgi:hypothetical protein